MNVRQSDDQLDFDTLPDEIYLAIFSFLKEI
jgi:hypothetical protein